MKTWILFQPVDTLFFRGNRPFTAGVDTFAELIFPTPLAIYGAIGDYILKKNKTNLTKFFAPKSPSVQDQDQDPVLGEYCEKLENTRLKIRGPFLYYDERLFLFPPANVYKKPGFIKICTPDYDSQDFKWDIQEPIKPVSLPDLDFTPLNSLLSINDLIRYLKNENISGFLGERELKDLIQEERRFGQKLNPSTLTVAEGYLYSTTHLRFKEELREKVYHQAGLMVQVELDGDNFSFTEEITFVGGERRMAKMVVKNEFSLPDIREKITDKFNQRFFIYLVTPAIFKNGWRPADFPASYNNCQLVGAVVNKPIYISGWRRTGDSAGYPRPLKKAVPAGGVYFFEASNWKKNEFKEFYENYNFNRSISDEYQSAGFGIGLIGLW